MSPKVAETVTGCLKAVIALQGEVERVRGSRDAHDWHVIQLNAERLERLAQHLTRLAGQADD